jgi:hypothetical protein
VALSFNGKRVIAEGTHVYKLHEFLEEFCVGGEDGDLGANRHAYHEPFVDIFNWAKNYGATSIFVGGSFVTDKPDPSDMDLLIVFSKVTDIPRSTDNFLVDDAVFDIQFVSDDQMELMSAFMELLSTMRSGVRHGVVQIKVDEQIPTYFHEVPSRELLEAVKGDYGQRHCVPLNNCKGVIVPIHGVRTHAEWLHQFSLLASISGWAVAPYVYGYKSGTTLISEKQKKRIVSGLRDWLQLVSTYYDGSISIVAHSLGSYIFGRYLEESKSISKNFDGVILCGSILSNDFDWASHLKSGRVGMVLNTLAPKDEWVKFMPTGRFANLIIDRRFPLNALNGTEVVNPI